MSVSRRVIHHGLYFAVLGPLIGVLFLVLYIFFAKEPLVLLVISKRQRSTVLTLIYW